MPGMVGVEAGGVGGVAGAQVAQPALGFLAQALDRCVRTDRTGHGSLPSLWPEVRWHRPKGRPTRRNTSQSGWEVPLPRTGGAPGRAVSTIPAVMWAVNHVTGAPAGSPRSRRWWSEADFRACLQQPMVPAVRTKWAAAALMAVLAAGCSKRDRTPPPRAEAPPPTPAAAPPAPATTPPPEEDARAAYVRSHYAKFEYRIPMRDGARLFTAVY